MENSKPNPIKQSIRNLRVTNANQRYSSNEYKAIFETIVLGTFTLVAILASLLFYSYWVLGNTQVLGRIFICGAALLYLAAAYAIWARQHHRTASRLVIYLYYVIAVIVMFGWGADTTFALLMLAITIVLTGVLLGARSVLLMSIAAISAITSVQIMISAGGTPWFDAGAEPSTFGGIIGFCVLLAILGLISALFDIRTQQLHAQELHANEVLTKQKGTLEKTVRIRSEQVEYLQLEKTEQLYKFAEIGQLSTLLLHDISNQIAVLNLDIADLKKQRSRGSTKHIEESIEYIEEAVRKVSRHLKLADGAKEFNVLECIRSSAKLPLYREYEHSITIVAPEDHPVLLHGEPLRFSHILFILIRNALESYTPATPPKERTVLVKLETTNDTTTVRVIDHGKGIPKDAQSQLFNPVRSKKKGGLGIGLFLAKEITESHFGGTLQLNDKVEHTEFVLTIPTRNSR